MPRTQLTFSRCTVKKPTIFLNLMNKAHILNHENKMNQFMRSPVGKKSVISAIVKRSDQNESSHNSLQNDNIQINYNYQVNNMNKELLQKKKNDTQRIKNKLKMAGVTPQRKSFLIDQIEGGDGFHTTRNTRNKLSKKERLKSLEAMRDKKGSNINRSGSKKSTLKSKAKYPWSKKSLNLKKFGPSFLKSSYR